MLPLLLSMVLLSLSECQFTILYFSVPLPDVAFSEGPPLFLVIMLLKLYLPPGAVFVTASLLLSLKCEFERFKSQNPAVFIPTLFFSENMFDAKAIPYADPPVKFIP